MTRNNIQFTSALALLLLCSAATASSVAMVTSLGVRGPLPGR